MHFVQETLHTKGESLVSNRLPETINTPMMVETAFLSDALSYEDFVLHCQEVAADAAHPQQSLYQKNLERMAQFYAHYQPDTALIAALALQPPQIWMILAEGWCGDVACTLPVLAKMATRQPNIQVCILLRDQNLSVMDLFLTNGGRAIPKLVAFSLDNTMLWQWGPRPAPAQNLLLDLKRQEIPFSDLVRQLLAWYDNDAAKTTEAELHAILT